jgi:hypothetical protein
MAMILQSNSANYREKGNLQRFTKPETGSFLEDERNHHDFDD